MASLATSMPTIFVPAVDLLPWGTRWSVKNAFSKKEGMDFGKVFDQAVAKSLASMLGGIPVIKPKSTQLHPSKPDCVELGDTRIIGGIRPQNYDCAYRPDGVRIAFDSKTLNDAKSIKKNWQNMINDLATESSTVHTRFPYAISAFMVIIPQPALALAQEQALIRTLERMATRVHVTDEAHLAEVISLVVWDPTHGSISATTPAADSALHIDNFSEIVFERYVERYKGLPPHD